MVPPLPSHTRLSFIEREDDTLISWQLHRRGPTAWIHLGFCVLFTVGWLAMFVLTAALGATIVNHPGALLHFTPVLLLFWLLFGFVVVIFWSGLEFWGNEQLVLTSDGVVFQRISFPRLFPVVESWHVDAASGADGQLRFRRGDKEVAPIAVLPRRDVEWLTRLANSRFTLPNTPTGVYR